jgi:hypothetical protein
MQGGLCPHEEIADMPAVTCKTRSSDKFLSMLPLIRQQAHHAFRAERADAQDELIAEVVANAYCTFRRLVERGKHDIVYATPLAQFAIRQVRSGRRVGAKLSVRDVTSHHVQRARGITVERLDVFDGEANEWREMLLEDRKAGPAETAAIRIDVSAWFKNLGQKKRRIARMLARGETTSTVARIFGLSAGRISQLRLELQRSWNTFQGELPAA